MKILQNRYKTVIFIVVFTFTSGFLHAMEEKKQVVWNHNNDDAEFQSRIFWYQKDYLRKIFEPICTRLCTCEKQVDLKHYIIPAVIGGSFLVGGIYSLYKGNFKTAVACAGGSMASCLFFPAGTFAQREFDTSNQYKKIKKHLLKKIKEEPIYPLYPGCDKFTTDAIRDLYQAPQKFNNEYKTSDMVASWICTTKTKRNKLFNDINNKRAQMPLIHFFLSFLFPKKRENYDAIYNGGLHNIMYMYNGELCDTIYKGIIIDLREYTMHLFDVLGKKEIDKILTQQKKDNGNCRQKLSAQAFSFFIKNINEKQLNRYLNRFLSFQSVNTTSNTKKEKKCVNSTHAAVTIQDLDNFSIKVHNLQIGFKYNALYVLYAALQEGVFAKSDHAVFTKKILGTTLSATRPIQMCFCSHAEILFGKRGSGVNEKVDSVKFQSTLCKNDKFHRFYNIMNPRNIDKLPFDLANFSIYENVVDLLFQKVSNTDFCTFPMSINDFNILRKMNVVALECYLQNILKKD